jgi:ribosome-associated translation inhibitor RaiA
VILVASAKKIYLLTACTMQVLLSAPALAGFSLDSVRNYAEERFAALQKYLPNFTGDAQVRIVVRKESIFYHVSVEIKLPQSVFLKVQNINLFAAIDELSKLIKRSASRYKHKARHK